MLGLNPLNDIRHRSMMWDSKRQMWIAGKMKLGDKQLVGDGEQKVIYVGALGAVKRLGRKEEQICQKDLL